MEKKELVETMTDNEELDRILDKFERNDNQILYIDTVGGEQTHRDDLWAVATAEISEAKAQILKSFTPNYEVKRLVREARIDEAKTCYGLIDQNVEVTADEIKDRINELKSLLAPKDKDSDENR